MIHLHWLHHSVLRWTALVALTQSLDAAEAQDRSTRLANTVILDATAAANLGIETAEAEEVTFEETIPVLGRIGILPGKRAVVSSRIPGRVKQVMTYPDRLVKQGDPLVVVESRQPGDPPPEITLTAPISGFVTELQAVVGEPVSPDRPLLAVVDLSVVHGVAQVPEFLADRILPGQKVRFTAPGWPGDVWDSKVEHIGAEVDAANGTLEVACHLKNEGTWLRPGMRGEFQIITASRPDVLAVPRAALQGDPVNRFVFVSDIELPNAFVRTPVVTGIENDRYVEIRQGLFPGEPVVIRGGYPLAFAGKGTVSLKEALDAAHGHAHNEDGSEITGQPTQTDDPGTRADHSHAASSAAPRFNLLTAFFAGTTGILLVLLIVQSARARRTASPTGSPHA